MTSVHARIRRPIFYTDHKSKSLMVATPGTDRPNTPVEEFAQRAEEFNRRARRLNHLVRKASKNIEELMENTEAMNEKTSAVVDEYNRRRARAQREAMVPTPSTQKLLDSIY